MVRDSVAKCAGGIHAAVVNEKVFLCRWRHLWQVQGGLGI
jgi:hypothetical protein